MTQGRASATRAASRQASGGPTRRATPVPSLVKLSRGNVTRAQALALHKCIGNGAVQRLFAFKQAPERIQRYGEGADREISDRERDAGERLETHLGSWRQLTRDWTAAKGNEEEQARIKTERSKLLLLIVDCLRDAEPALVAKALKPQLDSVLKVIRAGAETKVSALYMAAGSETFDFPYHGPVTDTGAMAGWNFPSEGLSAAAVLNAPNTISFVHATARKQLPNMQDQALKIMGGNKEFGEGFYTTSAADLGAAKKIGVDWFSQKQKNPDWVVLQFVVPTNIAAFILCTGPRADELNQFLIYVLTHHSGFPSGGAAPDGSDMDAINEINLQGRVLIFPDDKATEVETVIGPRTWAKYTADKLGGGGYELVVGPQQPEYMDGWRQYAWTGQRGMWLINSATRYVVYENPT